MTDEAKKIVKALNRCSCNREDDCTYTCPHAASDQYCRDQMESDAADMIKRMGAELERLKRENEKLREGFGLIRELVNGLDRL